MAGLRLAKSRYLGPLLRALLGKLKWDFAFATALDILAFHRLRVSVKIGAPTEADGDEIGWLRPEGCGRVHGGWKAKHLKHLLGHASPRVRKAVLHP